MHVLSYYVSLFLIPYCGVRSNSIVLQEGDRTVGIKKKQFSEYLGSYPVYCVGPVAYRFCILFFFLRPVSCAPKIVCVSILFIIDYPFSFSSLNVLLERRNIDINSHKNLSNFTLRRKIKLKNSACITCSTFQSHNKVFISEYNLVQVRNAFQSLRY